ncbi:MAG: M20/M25/M40 family metallo-hydrolase [Balneolaceae bacterium]|nr:M20/M25/M40 family metallo-hydrolase [Balneolaceae bacterium]
MMKSILTLLFAALIFISCSRPSPVEQAAQSITKESLMKPIEVLSSDAFRGRATGTEGEEKTVDYLVSYLEETCATPGMPDGGWVQQVPLIGQKTDQDATLYITRNGNRVHRFGYYDDFMAWPSNLEENVDVNSADLVYVGYGIQAPEENWDDFKGTDVKGKILVVKNNDPSSDPDLFEGDTRLYYGRYGYKYEKARELGAAGVLIIHTTPSAGYGWNVVANSWSRESFYLRGNEAMKNSPTKFNGWLTKEASTALFESAGMDLEEQLAAAEHRDFEPKPLGNLRLSLELQASYREQNGKNVLGVIEGNAQEKKDEYLVFTAHHDHLGMTSPVKGDSINNGALDNAAGVSATLNLAKAYCDVQEQLDRSILFLFVGAEEVGLLGSQYWAEHPTVHPGKVTGNINLDGMNVYGPTKDVVVIGYDRNTLSDMLEENAKERDRYLKPDPHPDRGYFYRSDHFSLAKKGIPAVFPDRGTEFVGKPDGYSSLVDSLEDANYHSVSDEINQYWDITGMVRDVRLFFETGYEVLNAPEMMKWREGDEFRAMRQKMLEAVEESEN